MKNIPFYYDHTNYINSKLNPSGVTVSNTPAATYFRRYLLQKAISVFSWNMPKNWSKDYFLYVLYCVGNIAIIKTDKYGVIPQQCTLSGYNVFYQPRTATVVNPLLKGGENLLIDKQCVVFKLEPDYGGIMDMVNLYADLMALAVQAAGVNLINSKLAYVFGADSKSVADSFKKAADEVESGKPFVVVDKSLMKNDGTFAMQFFQQNLRQNFIAPELLNTLQQLYNMFATEIGLPNSNMEKKERLIVDEVNANNVETMTRCDLWLDGWKESCAKAKEIFGVEISVNWRVKPKEKGGKTDEKNGES